RLPALSLHDALPIWRTRPGRRLGVALEGSHRPALRRTIPVRRHTTGGTMIRKVVYFSMKVPNRPGIGLQMLKSIAMGKQNLLALDRKSTRLNSSHLG